MTYEKTVDMSFRELLKASIKSQDTEEWIDIYFTRPVGLVFALFWQRLGVHPNAITVLSMFLGVASAVMFCHTELWYNVAGIMLLMFANFCDSTDGQLARLTGKKTLVGRVLDGFAGDVWFFSIYLALCMRMMHQQMPLMQVEWGVWIWLLAFVAGVLCHSPQSSLADYYRQIHLFFLKGKDGSELDSYESQRAIYENLPRHGSFWARAFYYNYKNYCRSQERRTPQFQRFGAKLKDRFRSIENVPQELRDEFCAGSRPLMPYANILTFNMRAVCIYATCLLDCPWLYFLAEIIIFNIIYIYMRYKHETLCARLADKI